MRMLLLILAALCCVFSPDAAVAQEPARLLAGRPLRDALQIELTLTARDAVVRDLLSALQRDTGIPVVLDRRVDPYADLGTYAGAVTVEELLRQIAVTLECGVSFGDHFVYIGPEPSAGRLRTVMELRRQDIAAVRSEVAADVYRALVANVSASWPRLAQPRDLVVRAARKVGLGVRDPEVIPHDLWRAAELPAMPFADRATLVLNQFDLTFELDEQGTAIQIVPVPESVAVEQPHRVAARRVAIVERRWIEEFPDLAITWQGATAIVSATIEQHERLKELIAEQ